MGAYCLCKHPKESHTSTVINGKVVPYCTECEECTGFGAIKPEVPRALLLAAEPAGDRVDESTLIYAWDAHLCTSCEWRTSADVVACLQCGAALAPVRIEVHSRESQEEEPR